MPSSTPTYHPKPFPPLTLAPHPLRPPQVNLDKVVERWWDCAFVGEPKINVRNIDASRPVEELDGAAQSKVHELLAQQREKKMKGRDDAQMVCTGGAAVG